MADLFLLDLKQQPGAALLARVRERTSPQFAALADRLARGFLIRTPSAPGFCCLGGEIALDADGAQAVGAARMSVTGNGESLDDALIACLGEVADRLSHIGRPEDVLASSALASLPRVIDGWIGQVIPPADALDWMPAHNAASAAAIALPADVCIRRPAERRQIKPAGALSSGVAAGPDFASAALRAGLELCERDALALWWIGGARPRAFSIEHPAHLAGTQLVAALRQDRTDRATQLLDITTDLEIPTVAAISLDGNGRGLACGLAARLDWAGAARAAILELCQMELAAPLAEAKRLERGEAALNEVDRLHLQRAAFKASDCDLLSPRSLSGPRPGGDTAESLEALAARLDARGVRLFVTDLTRPDIGIAVARLVSPDLQPYTADVATERLSHCRATHDPVGAATAAISLM